jgi:hypothetical protein
LSGIFAELSKFVAKPTMTSSSFLLRSIFVLVVAAAGSMEAQQPAATWPAVLLAQPMHIGDDTNKEMTNLKPDAPKFSATFELPANVKPGVASMIYVTIEVGGMVPINNKKTADALKTSKLKVNGSEIAILNKLIRGEDSPKKIAKLSIRVPGTVLRPGSNELEIIPGATTKTIDDFELHRVVVGSSAQ